MQSIQISVIIPDTTNQFFFSLLSSFMSPSHGEKWLMWDNKRSNKERTGNSDWNGVFLWGDFKWQCNRCPLKAWLCLINLDCSDKSGLLLASTKTLKPPIFFHFLCRNNSMGGWHDNIRISIVLIMVYLLNEFLCVSEWVSQWVSPMNVFIAQKNKWL